MEDDRFPSDERIVQAAKDLLQAFGDKGAGFSLPFGAIVEVGRPGSVEIDGRIYVRRRKVPGLHPIEVVPRDAHGRNLEELRHAIRFRTSSTRAAEVGLPTSALVGHRGTVRHLLEFPPL